MTDHGPQRQPESEAEALAKLFHETYERLAPQFGYETRKDSAVPWDQVPEQNKALMIAVCKEINRILRGKEAECWRDDDAPEAETTRGVRPASDELQWTPVELQMADVLVSSLLDQRREAAAELARLRAENERLRAALEQFAYKRNWISTKEDDTTWWMWQITDDPRKLAADALRGDTK